MKLLTYLLALLFIFAPLPACSSQSTTVTTDGSTSMEKLIGFLSEGYMKENEGLRITYNPTGSAAGIQAVANNRCDIGLSSRELKPEEEKEVLATAVAIDGIALIVNPENTISDIDMETIAKLYNGEISNWKEIGGNDAPVVTIGREAASGTREAFETITETENMCRYSQELTSTGDVVQTVASNPNALGYASPESVKSNVKILSVSGIYPEAEALRNGEYKLQRKFFLITKKDAPLNDYAQAFFDFTTSAEADSLIIRAGAVPIKR